MGCHGLQARSQGKKFREKVVVGTDGPLTGSDWCGFCLSGRNLLELEGSTEKGTRTSWDGLGCRKGPGEQDPLELLFGLNSSG